MSAGDGGKRDPPRDHVAPVRHDGEADLRERVHDGKWSMITRIKTRKNRPKVLHAISKLETKLAALNQQSLQAIYVWCESRITEYRSTRGRPI